MTPIGAVPTATRRSRTLAKHPTLGNQGVVTTSDHPPASQAVTRLRQRFEAATNQAGSQAKRALEETLALRMLPKWSKEV